MSKIYIDGGEGDYIQQNVKLIKNRSFLFERLIEYSRKYEISFQMWPKQNTIYIEKDGVELQSFGGYDTAEDVMTHALEYLNRINKSNNQTP